MTNDGILLFALLLLSKWKYFKCFLFCLAQIIFFNLSHLLPLKLKTSEDDGKIWVHLVSPVLCWQVWHRLAPAVAIIQPFSWWIISKLMPAEFQLRMIQIYFFQLVGGTYSIYHYYYNSARCPPVQLRNFCSKTTTAILFSVTINCVLYLGKRSEAQRKPSHQ